MSLTINNNPLIDAYNILESVIKTNVQDVNETRRALSTAREKQWIFPTTPEDEIGYYPRIAIVLNSISYDELGSGQFAGYQTAIDGSVYDLKMNYAILNMTIGIFTKKKEKFSVTLPGATTAKSITGTLLNAYLLGEVVNKINKYRDTFIQNDSVDIIINNVNQTYSDSEVLFASDISIKLIMPNVWGRVYTTAELIATINKTYTVESE
jgi:hypothetical protein